MTDRSYDLIAIGRSSIDLYANDIGSPFEDIKSFGSFVGGCPTNIAVGTCRLGLKSALVTAVGEDPVGSFILKFLRQEGIETAFIPKKQGKRTSAVLLGIEPPDRFPLVYYRDNCADIELTIADLETVPIEQSKAMLISGTGFSRDPSRSAHLHALERARRCGTTVFLDLDFRADQWLSAPAQDIRAYGLAVRSILHMCDIVFGTEEEIKAAMLESARSVEITHSQISAPTVHGDVNKGIDTIINSGPKALVVKEGSRGSTVHCPGRAAVKAKPFSVEVCNVLGAGDAYASGFIYGYNKGWDWQRCATMGNAVGAIVVTRQGCANFMPFEQEALDFVASQGGFTREEASCPS